MINMAAAVSKEDIKTVRKQLKREPKGLKGIASRCSFGRPQVIENEAFIEGKPFPTLYWLTCPIKVKAVSRLEGMGWSKIFREKLWTKDFSKQFYAAQEDYRRRRSRAAGNANHPVFSTGIGGVKELCAVKCLHAHYAHYLATGSNPVGEMVDNMLSNIECRECCNKT